MTTVMLVDDSRTIRLSLQAVLERSGFEVQVAAGAPEALVALDRGVPDLIITDLNMPEMDGVEFIRRVRALPALKFTPVLFLTNESERAKRDLAKASGATGWIVKPVKADDLLDVIRTVLPTA